MAAVRVAYVFATSGHTASYKLGQMILPQLEAGHHGYLLRQGDAMGERLAAVAADQGIMLMLCDRCALERGLATGQPGDCDVTGTVDGVKVGCFPDLYAALSANPPDQVITL